MKRYVRWLAAGALVAFLTWGAAGQERKDMRSPAAGRSTLPPNAAEICQTGAERWSASRKWPAAARAAMFQRVMAAAMANDEGAACLQRTIGQDYTVIGPQDLASAVDVDLATIAALPEAMRCRPFDMISAAFSEGVRDYPERQRAGKAFSSRRTEFCR